MKRVFKIYVSTVLVLYTVVFLAKNVEASTITASLQCYNFNTNLSYGQGSNYKALADMASSSKRSSDYSKYNMYASDYKKDVNALQLILEKEGFPVSTSEKGTGTIGLSTASAIVQFQNRNKDKILTPKGLSYGTGVVDDETRKLLNQKYGCTDKTVTDKKLTVTSPNSASANLKMNKTVTVTWTVKSRPVNLNAYELYLIDTTANKTNRISTAPQNALSALWNVPPNGILGSGSTQITGIGDSSAKKYKIEVRMVDAGGVTISSDESDSAFSITR